MANNDDIIRLHPEIAKASVDIIKKNDVVLKDAPYDTVVKVKDEIKKKGDDAKSQANSAQDDETKQVFEQIAAMYQISLRALDYLTQYMAPGPAPAPRKEMGLELIYTAKPSAIPVPSKPAPGPSPTASASTPESAQAQETPHVPSLSHVESPKEEVITITAEAPVQNIEATPATSDATASASATTSAPAATVADTADTSTVSATATVTEDQIPPESDAMPISQDSTTIPEAKEMILPKFTESMPKESESDPASKNPTTKSSPKEDHQPK